ncbi:MAG: ethanolamine ammonia-lyase reactivating factor EutA [Clostridium sp.]|jgi:ethanolamine utilization protein EutA|uniref:ethanolamine ammonia-lyase reactivating factor EutA n=1 Tax=Clostridium sp. TaxID=1506 RepID=UPI0025C5EF1E|nr:ethanolamine ammonia-lyase reactivating factor EutA [Clostridium sp.]MCH3963730.1 ethanolamine ammonia-lyase reactivating factor EutA [Clostridium sp.]MCI1714871.1 ethanolamine ammonia-lyase reactivating factor EutA [Clostridium sp.]MCI1798940.1 ethanolamine ammonia-lyase reactivating factor EutA [Clostridium sp.]MCI1813054.1 ethanolamine ammonia-lyase reactivating factor EutA [Clostridium sp.]MCI1869944.1 ethanolamine ammonia-lyase reactivating factor EutA [Clostridium sp.]
MNKVLSVGIDIGTTTTQIVFSELTIQNTAGSFLVPRIKIVDKNIIYKSNIYFTPLVSRETIDLLELEHIIEKEYDMACVKKDDISTGAIIMTGETARKENAEKILNILSDFAGDFVIATAGADLESILAGCGSGAMETSKNISGKVMNFDIGGGTTNVSVFQNGKIADCFALDIGGRLIQLDSEGNTIYISHKIMPLIENLNLNIRIGIKAEFMDLYNLCKKFAHIILKIGNKVDLSDEEVRLFIGHENRKFKTEVFMFSGGVAEFVYSDYEVAKLEDTLKYGDIGPLLGNCIRDSLKEKNYSFMETKEKIRATVIGAGSHSVKISGSTIVFDENILPMKNVPIIKAENDLPQNDIYKYVSHKISMYCNSPVAVSFRGPVSPSYAQIQKMADSIIQCFKVIRNFPIIVIVENDFAKALGQAIKIKCELNRKVICLDGISTENGDYIDIGRAISGVIPVSVKTLIFDN